MRNITKTIGLAGLAAAMVTHSANAESFSRSASVQLFEPITLSGTDMDFGRVTKPASGTETVILDNNNNRSGTATLLPGGTAASANYLISGNTNETISIDVYDNGGDAGLALSSFTVIYDAQPMFTDSGAGLPGPGAGTNMSVGATLTIDSANVGEGLLARNYNVDINYE